MAPHDVTVTTADVICSNGVVHIVDAVLMPSYLSADQLAAAEPMIIVETAQSVPELSSLVGTVLIHLESSQFSGQRHLSAAFSRIVYKASSASRNKK